MPSPKKKPPPKTVEADLNVSGQEEFDQLWLVEALRLVRGARRKQYGHIYHNWKRWRLMLAGILGFAPSYTQCAYIIITMKMCRELSTPHPDHDNNRDIAGFIQCLQDTLEKAKELEDDDPA